MQVDKQSAHFFGVTINDQQAQAGIVVRVTSAIQSKFKVNKIGKLFQTTCGFIDFQYKLNIALLSSVIILYALSIINLYSAELTSSDTVSLFQLLYFEQEANGGYDLALQVYI